MDSRKILGREGCLKKKKSNKEKKKKGLKSGATAAMVAVASLGVGSGGVPTKRPRIGRHSVLPSANKNSINNQEFAKNRENGRNREIPEKSGKSVNPGISGKTRNPENQEIGIACLFYHQAESKLKIQRKL